MIETVSVWNFLQSCEKPIVLYGMGDGALKILAVCEEYEIPIRGIFASDGFVRGHSFQGFPVRRLQELEAELGDLVVLLAFGVNYDSMIDHIRLISHRHLVLAPDLPVVGEGLFTPMYVQEHSEDFARAYGLLADQESRRIFTAMLNYKISGKLEYLFATMGSRLEDFHNLLRLGDEEDYLDLGAYDGDTVQEFLEQVESYRSITALEPDPKNYRKLVERVQALEAERVTCHNMGSYSFCGSLPFSDRSGRNSAYLAKGRGQAPVTTVDALLGGARASYIKMDVEGAERETLLGCRKTIRQHRPILSIAAYHRNEDLFALPAAVQELGENYRLYLRRHKYIPAWEILLYGIPVERAGDNRDFI